MEHRYRYPSVRGSKGKRRAIGQAVKFIIGWQLLGLILWRLLKKHSRNKDPKGTEYFDKRPNSEKIMIMKGFNPERDIPHLKVSPSGIAKEQWKDNTTLETSKLTTRGFQKISEQAFNSEATSKVVLLQKEADNLQNRASSPSQTIKTSPTQKDSSDLLQSTWSYSLGSIFSFSWFRKQDES